MSGQEDHSIDLTLEPRTAVFGGVMRLESVEAYERLFEPLRAAMTASPDRYTLDLTGVIFMNSSGIRAVAALVLAAKRAGIPLRIRSDSKSPWQKKTLPSLRLLHAGLELESSLASQSSS